MDFITIGRIIAKVGIETFAQESVKNLVDTHIKPLITDHAKKDRLPVIEEIIQEYLEQSYDYNVKMNTIIFGNEDKTIFDLYIPLYLKKGDFHIESDETYIIGQSDAGDEYADEDSLLEKYNRILIVDTAGMGKSTIVKYLVIKEINDNRLVPLSLEIRRIKEGVSIIDYILEEFDLYDKKLSRDEAISMLKRGEFIIFFDGYDEISEGLKAEVSIAILDFIKKLGKNKYIITSREEKSLGSFRDFQRFVVKPLSLDEAFALIEKYGKAGGKQIEVKAKNLINTIKNDSRMQVIQEFLVNPLLVSLLLKTYIYKGQIPYKKVNFYRQAYDALFNDHDLTKDGYYIHEKESKLDVDDFATILRALAFLSLQKEKVEYGKDELLCLIGKAMKLVPHVKAKASPILNDLTHSVPLMQQEGNNYKWMHKSFMEYFAACFICYEIKQDEEAVINSMIDSDNNYKYINVLDFCYDLDGKTCRKLILYRVVKEYVEYYENSFLDLGYSNYSKYLLDLRKQVSFTEQQKIYRCNFGKNNAKFSREIQRNGAVPSFFFDPPKSKDEDVYVLVENKHQLESICMMLYEKKIDIFSKDKPGRALSKSDKRKLTELLDQNMKKNDLILSDNISDFYNVSEDNFRLMTINLISARIAGLSYRKCKKIKEQIEKEMEREEKNKYFLD